MTQILVNDTDRSRALAAIEDMEAEAELEEAREAYKALYLRWREASVFCGVSDVSGAAFKVDAKEFYDGYRLAGVSAGPALWVRAARDVTDGAEMAMDNQIVTEMDADLGFGRDGAQSRNEWSN